MFDNLPAGSVVLYKKYSLWDRMWAKIRGKQLPYNGILVDPFGNSSFMFVRGWFYKYDIDVFIPKKPYSKKESTKLLSSMKTLIDDEVVFAINAVRPNTLVEGSLGEMFENNKYYNKKSIK